MTQPAPSDVVLADAILVGGGLTSSLIALRLKRQKPDLKIIMLERDARIGGEHTWCHFATDVSPAISEWLAPLIVHDWAGYDVRFPAHRRTLSTRYRAITSDRLHEVMLPLMGADAWLGVEASEVKAESVRLVDGRRLAAPLVIDARGPRGWPRRMGWSGRS
jgi:lycopene beta-cyclase